MSNVVERWLGIGRVQIQTASGKSRAEMTIEGLPDYEAVRDQLYGRMRGARAVVGRVDHGEPAKAPSRGEESLTTWSARSKPRSPSCVGCAPTSHESGTDDDTPRATAALAARAAPAERSRR